MGEARSDDAERCALRPRNVHSADDWRTLLEPAVARYREIGKRRYFRGDADFAKPRSTSSSTPKACPIGSAWPPIGPCRNGY